MYFFPLSINSVNSREKKTNLSSSGFCSSTGPQSEYKRARKDKQILGYGYRAKKKKPVEYKGDTNCCESVWKVPQGIRKKAGRIENQKKNRDHLGILFN